MISPYYGNGRVSIKPIIDSILKVYKTLSSSLRRIWEEVPKPQKKKSFKSVNVKEKNGDHVSAVSKRLPEFFSLKKKGGEKVLVLY